jgi:NAD(P)-dependent dehydrogenase (short-subunit alcohol dehydrogenase family)
MDPERASFPTVVVTGAGRGLGLALVQRAVIDRSKVFALYRSWTNSLAEVTRAAPSQVIPIAFDGSDEASVDSCAARICEASDEIDLLINNAGVSSRTLPSPSVGAGPAADVRPAAAGTEWTAQVSANMLDAYFMVNTITPLRFTHALIPALRRARSPRVVNVSSIKGSVALTYGGTNYGYAMSKAALNIGTRIMAGYLDSIGIIAVAVHPGWVRTRLGGPSAELDPAEAACGIFKLIETLKSEDSGRFIGPDGHNLPW